MKTILRRHLWSAFLIPFAFIIGGCSHKSAIQSGSKVTLNYTLNVDGRMVDSSHNGHPLAFVIGSRQVIPGLEEQLMGLHAGDKKTFAIPPEKAYGPVRPDAVQKVPRKNFNAIKGIKPGMTVTAQGNGNVIQARVIDVSSDTVSLDLNHPLAGKTLNFDVEVVSVEMPKKSS